MLSRNRGLRFELDDLREELAALRTELPAVQVRTWHSCTSAGALRPCGLSLDRRRVTKRPPGECKWSDMYKRRTMHVVPLVGSV